MGWGYGGNDSSFTDWYNQNWGAGGGGTQTSQAAQNYTSNSWGSGADWFKMALDVWQARERDKANREGMEFKPAPLSPEQQEVYQLLMDRAKNTPSFRDSMGHALGAMLQGASGTVGELPKTIQPEGMPEGIGGFQPYKPSGYDYTDELKAAVDLFLKKGGNSGAGGDGEGDAEGGTHGDPRMKTMNPDNLGLGTLKRTRRDWMNEDFGQRDGGGMQGRNGWGSPIRSDYWFNQDFRYQKPAGSTGDGGAPPPPPPDPQQQQQWRSKIAEWADKGADWVRANSKNITAVAGSFGMPAGMTARFVTWLIGYADRRYGHSQGGGGRG